VPRYKEIADEIFLQIERGEYLPNDKLPTIRALAAKYEVNTATIVSAYKCLEQKRAVYSVLGSGTYASAVSAARRGKTDSFLGDAPEDILDTTPEDVIEAMPKGVKGCINFASTMPSGECFPKEAFGQAFDSVLVRDGSAAFAMADEKGYAPLREAFAEVLAHYKINATTSEIQVISGIRQGLEFVLGGLISPGDAVVLESPCPSWIQATVASFGAKIYYVPLTPTGLDVEKLALLTKKYRPKLFFLMPVYQTPTGLCYTESDKAKILEFALRASAYIIEADVCSDFFYKSRPTPLKAIAGGSSANKVIYMKSFDRILAPGLGGCIVADESVVMRPCEGQDFSSRGMVADIAGSSGFVQRGLDYYLRNGDFAAHCTKMREVFSKRCRQATAAAETFLSPYADFVRPTGGLNLWVTPKAKRADYSAEFLRRRVLVSPSNLYDVGTFADNSFGISFASASTDDIFKGIGIIAEILGT